MEKSPESWMLGDYRIHQSREGFHNLWHIPSEEIMHSRSCPEEEAEQLYVAQADLHSLFLSPTPSLSSETKTALKTSQKTPPIVLWDVGLGAATNAMAAIHLHQQLSASCPTRIRPLHIISFDIDLTPLKLALSHVELFPSLNHPAPDAILHTSSYKDNLIHWEFIQKSYPEAINDETPAPDIVFYDLYSAKTHLEAWRPQAFIPLYQKTKNKKMLLITYTTSTAARAALLASGLYVAKGKPFGLKSDTTLALSPLTAATGTYPLLDHTWLQKFKRSTANTPSYIPVQSHAIFQQSICNHPQFKLLRPTGN